VARKHGGPRRYEAFHAYVFMTPAILGLLLFTLGPVVASLLLSFTDYDLLTDPAWVGAQNYAEMFGDSLFWQSMRVTAIYSIVSVPAGLALGLGLAVLLNHKMRGVMFFRSVYYLPTVISGVGVAMLWRWLFNSEFGIINVLLRDVGIRGPAWLTDERWALPALIIASLWGVGGTTLNVLLPNRLLADAAARQQAVQVLCTYLHSGGQMAQITTANLEDLLDARIHPERHGDLIVRVGGFSRQFVQFDAQTQEEIISRYAM
jgi:ABC-type Fe3+ transport system permease subunit